MSDLVSSIRKLKHDYSEEFGRTIVSPARALIDECLSNPELFDKKETRDILKAYTNAIRLQTTYDLLGYSFESQVSDLKSSLALITDLNVQLFSEVLKSKRDNSGNLLFHNAFLGQKLEFAVNNMTDFGGKLSEMDHYDFGKTESFSLIREIDSFFEKDAEEWGRQGHVPYSIRRNFDRSIDDCVSINLTGFEDHVLGNIVKNLHMHAFVSEERYDYQVHLATVIQEDKLILFIENNGEPFYDDVNAVFQEGVGSGNSSGIGLYSAKQFLEHYGCSISMKSLENNKYTVSFIISFPHK